MGERSTIKDVARAAGVGVSTVSRVINGRGYVSDPARERVLQAVTELHFEPSRAARTLTTGRSGTVALVLPDITNPFFPSIARGVEDAASAAGYAVVLCNTDNDPKQEARYIAMLREQRVDGVVLAACAPTNRDYWVQFAERVPLVLTDRRLADFVDDSIGVDNVAGGRLATRHLLGLGHRRIGLIGGPPDLSTSADRRLGYEEALREAGIDLDPGLVRPGDFRYAAGYLRMRELLDQNVTAVFAANDMMAVGAMRAVEDAGGRVPEDVAVVGFDDIPMASMVKPRLTTVAQPTYQMGVMAVGKLLRRLKGGPPEDPRQVVLELALVVRDSCGAKEIKT